MLNDFLHYYFLINTAIAVSYLLTRGSLLIKLFQRELSPTSTLKFMRYCFITAIMLFLVMPEISHQFTLPAATFSIHPLFKHNSFAMLEHPISLSKELIPGQYTSPSLSMQTVLTYLGLIGFIFFAIRLIYNMYSLHAIYGRSSIYHRFKNIHIFFSDEITTPFCWSFLKKAYIALPRHFLTKAPHMKIAIRHELQHIRQRDTLWLHVMNILSVFCYWNPIIKLWSSWMKDQQEFACDESMMLKKTTSPITYADCLVDTVLSQRANAAVIGMGEFSKSKLYRRIDMLFNYHQQKRSFVLITAYCLSMLTMTTAAFAITQTNTLSANDVKALITHADDQPLHLTYKPEVVSVLNELRQNPQQKKKILAALQRMTNYQQYIQAELKQKNMPADLLALPLVESGYQALDEKVNPVKAAGIWQIIPSTAKNLGLTISATRDDRLNTQLATRAALKYLASVYEQFHDWKLAVVAYEIGEDKTAKLINETKSRDPWKFVNAASLSPKMKSELTYYLALFDASIIIMHHPDLLS